MSESMFNVLETTNKDVSAIESSDLRLGFDCFDEMCAFINRSTHLSFDIETSGLSTICDKVVGFSFSDGVISYYVPIAHAFENNLDSDLVLVLLNSLSSKKLVYHNAKFDWKFIYSKYGIDLPITDDTLLLFALLESDRIASTGKLSLDGLVKEFFNIEMLSLIDDLGTTDFSLVKLEDAVPYAAFDSLMTYKLFSFVNKKYIVDSKFKFIYDLELNLLKMIAKMELRGVAVDFDYASSVSEKLSAEVLALKNKAEEFCGFMYDINSPKQLSKMLYEVLKIPMHKNSSSTDKKVLNIIKNSHPIIPILLEYSELNTLYSSFFSKISEVVAEDGRIHSSFNQVGTRSGRFTCSGGVGRGGCKISINLQQLPKKDKFGFRNCVKSDNGSYWLHADYSQLEYRTMASLSGENSLIDAYFDGVDFHKKTASIFLNKDIDMISEADRDKGKRLNFGVSYGMSKYGLANELGITPDKAEELLSNYFKNLPNLKNLIKSVKKNALKDKSVRTHFGRKRMFSNMPPASDVEAITKYLRKTFNSYIQGTSADIAKLGLFSVYNAINESGLDIVPVLTVHDELNFEVNKSVPVNVAAGLVRKAMSLDLSKIDNSVRWTPFPVDIEVGTSFGNSEKFDLDLSPESSDIYFDSWYSSLSKTDKISIKESNAEVYVAVKPYMVLSNNYSKKNLELLQKLFSSSRGNYTVFLKLPNSYYKCELRINPLATVINTLKDYNFVIERISEDIDSFDIENFIKEL